MASIFFWGGGTGLCRMFGLAFGGLHDLTVANLVGFQRLGCWMMLTLVGVFAMAESILFLRLFEDVFCRLVAGFIEKTSGTKR